MLDLTVYKTPPLLELDMNVLPGIMKTLWYKIDKFFSDYQTEDTDIALMIKLNIERFLRLLINENPIVKPRYIHFYGIGGIGKSRLIMKISKWINQLIPNAIYTDINITVSGVNELEGMESYSNHCPGVFLNVLRGQLASNRRASLICMDEAQWLSKESDIPAVKRIFNGDLSTISTKYFGSSINGGNYTFKVPPMLIFVANNQPIKDEALASRFDSIEFPHLKKESMIKIAQKIISMNYPSYDSVILGQIIEELQISNVRTLQSKIERAVYLKENNLSLKSLIFEEKKEKKENECKN